MKKDKIELTPRQNVVRRLKIAEGHLRKIIEMVEDGTYCIDVMQQTSAVRSAIKKAEEVLLINHLNSCVVDALTSGGQKKVISELEQVFRKID